MRGSDEQAAATVPVRVHAGQLPRGDVVAAAEPTVDQRLHAEGGLLRVHREEWKRGGEESLGIRLVFWGVCSTNTRTKGKSFATACPHLVERSHVFCLVVDERLVSFQHVNELRVTPSHHAHQVLGLDVRRDDGSLQHVEVHSHVLRTRTHRGQSEVDEHEVARVLLDDEVGRRQVAVNLVVVVKAGDRLAYLETVLVQFLLYRSSQRKVRYAICTDSC